MASFPSVRPPDRHLSSVLDMLSPLGRFGHSSSQIRLPARAFSTSIRRAMATPRFAAGVDAESLTSSVTPLLAESGGRWTLAAEGEALERSFKFKTFAKTWVRDPGPEGGWQTATGDENHIAERVTNRTS